MPLLLSVERSSELLVTVLLSRGATLPALLWVLLPVVPWLPMVVRVVFAGVVTVEGLLLVLPVLRPTVPRLLVELLLLVCGATVVLRLVVDVLRLTCELLELLRFTCGVAELLRELLLELLLELLRLTCGVAELLLRLEAVLLLRFTCGVADELLERETAADWLLLELPPCERLRPWAEASDAPMIRHPMSAKLIIRFLTEVFIIVLYY